MNFIFGIVKLAKPSRQIMKNTDTIGMENNLALIKNLRKIISKQEKMIRDKDTKIEKLLDERFLSLTNEPRKAYIKFGRTKQYKIQRELTESIKK
jgi:hypothetical protein